MLSGNETPAPAGQVCEDGVCYIDFSKRKQAQSSTSTSTIASQVDSALTSTPVMVYSKTYCPYCDKAKELLSHKGVKYTSVELDSVTDGEKMHAYLKEKTGQTSVPNIFIGGKHIGGCSDLLELEQKGELDTLLKSLL
ncbi:thioredoxin-like protein [Phlyctochytrium arcticum]|nr:thioredoxin-like protein [Phlyctochytrium arcticum]